MPRFQFDTPTKTIIPQPGDKRVFGHGSIVELDEETAARLIKSVKGFDGDPCLVRVPDETPILAVAPVVDHPVERQPQRSIDQRKVSNDRVTQVAAPKAEGPTTPAAGKKAEPKPTPAAKGGPTTPPPRAEG